MATIKAIDDDDLAQEVVGFADLGFANASELDAYIQEGVDDIDAGRVVPHSIVMADVKTLLAKLAADRLAAKR